MSRIKLDILLGLASLVLFLLGAVFAWLLMLWLQTNGRAQFFYYQPAANYAVPLSVLMLILLIGMGYMVNRLFRLYTNAAKQLAEETTIILTANPEYRVPLEGPAEIQKLAETVNSFADRFQVILANQEAKIIQARSDLEEEKNRLAALMSELSEGVLVCNLEGQILLYNNRAKQLLSPNGSSQSSGAAGGFIGLGRSVFGLIERDSITHVLQHLAYKLEKQSTDLVSQFVTTASNGQLMRARITPVLDQNNQLSGFILTLEDITEQLKTSSRKDILLQSLVENIRASLGNIRAAIETMMEYPEMNPKRLERFRGIIREESLKLSSALDRTMAEYGQDLKSQWQLEDMLGADLLRAIKQVFEAKFNVTTDVTANEDNLWLKVDSYSLVQALASIMCELKDEFGVSSVLLRLARSGRFAAFDLIWNCSLLDTERLNTWQNEVLTADGHQAQISLQEVAERHGGEVWYQSDKATKQAYFRLLLPTTQPKSSWNIQVVPASRPEYYDFDLFHQPGQRADLDNRPLSELTYTVFDTETTGLNPSQGDEIISIGAVRILNGRILRHEIFDQLIDPRRPVPRASVEIHGISPKMLKGQPTIDQVLPQFHRFAEDTVLVAHNAAFDMRFLQLKEEQTGAKFINPVLDTLLLAAVVQPNQEVHSLEALAKRLGINILGRHTSLGDAIVTAEVFLKLIPLLQAQGIVTLKEARTAAEKTYYARINY
jgi:DNA polymerase-3 subunit epsilon